MYWKDKCTLLSSSSFFLCKTFKLRSSLEINWHGFTCCSRAAIIYEGLMHFKSRHLRQRQREYCKPQYLLKDHIPSSSRSPHDCSPHLLFKSRLGRDFLIHQHLGSGLGTGSTQRSRAAARSCSMSRQAGTIPLIALSTGKVQAPPELHLRDPLSPRPIPEAPGGSGCPTPFTLQLERRAPRPARPCKSPGFPWRPCTIRGFYFASLQSN